MVSLSSVQSDYGDLNKWFKSLAPADNESCYRNSRDSGPFHFSCRRNFTRSTTEDYLRDDVRRRDRATWQLLVLLSRHRSKQNCCSVTELRRGGHANRRRYSPAYKGDGSMLHPQRNSAGNNPDVIPSAKATKGSALKTAQRLSHQLRAAEDRDAALMRSVIGIAGFMLAIVSPTIGLRGHDRGGRALSRHSATRRAAQMFQVSETGSEGEDGRRRTSEEARRWIVQSERRCTGEGETSGTGEVGASRTGEVGATSTGEDGASRTGEDGTRQHQRRRRNLHRSKQHQRRRSNPHRSKRTSEDGATRTGASAPANTEQPAPANTDEAAPAITETTTKSNTGEALFSPTPDDPATTSSIDRLSVAGQPLCVDAEALAAMILAGLLTSDPTKAATDGCQTLPGDAKLRLLERYPSVFPSIRIVRVRVTSPPSRT